MVNECGLMQGIYFDDSSKNKDSVYIYFFVLPLFVPTEHLYFNYGARMKRSEGNEMWQYADAFHEVFDNELENAVQSQALPYFDSVCNLHDFTQEAFGRRSDDPHWLEANAYARCLLTKDHSLRADVLNALKADLLGYNEVRNFAWVNDKIDRASMLFDTNSESGKGLDQWFEMVEQENLSKLKLKRNLPD